MSKTKMNTGCMATQGYLAIHQTTQTNMTNRSDKTIIKNISIDYELARLISLLTGDKYSRLEQSRQKVTEVGGL